MSNPSEKRAADSTLQSASKKAKTDEPIDRVENLNAIFVRDLDLHITKPNFWNGICSTRELQLAEASYLTSIIPPYQTCQLRMLKAQSRHSPVLLPYLTTNIDRLVEVKRTMTIKAAKRLLPLARVKAIEDRPDMRDAILYRVAFLIAYHAYYTRSTAEVFRSYQDMGEVEDCKDISALVEELTAASERHLSKDCDRSYLWQKHVQPTVSSKTVSSNNSDLHSGGQSSVHSLGHIHDIAKPYIKSANELAASYDIVEWSNMDALDEEMKQCLQIKRVVRKIPRENEKSAPTPPGMLLHGVGGCGKTEVVMSWCQFLGATLIIFDRSIQESLAGHTEKAIKYLFEQAIEIAKSGPVVLFFDEADQLLATSPTDDNRSLHAAIKDYFSSVLKARGDIHVVAATNHPERIDMKDWNRRLQLKIHVRPPQQAGIQQIVQVALQDHNHSLSATQISDLAKELVGFTAHDILSIIEESACCEERVGNKSWVEKIVNGRPRLVAAGNERSSLLRSLQDMTDFDLGRVRLADLCYEMITRVLRHGMNTGKIMRTYTVEELHKHEIWNKSMSAL